MYCNPNDHWSACAKRVKEAIRTTNDPTAALAAASEWSVRYRMLYEANPQETWTATDQERIEDKLQDLWDDAVGQYLDPAALAWAMALAKYAKTLAAMLEWMSAPAAAAFYVLLAPSPIANDFTAAKPENTEINNLLFSKFPHPVQQTIRLRYPPTVNRAYEEATGGNGLP